MPPLNNPRHERFCQALFEGKPANQAYAEAGYQPHDGNCIRLRGNERVKARLLELQTQAQKTSEVTVASLLAELEHARSRADSLDQLSASVKAIEAKAKVSGLLTQKIEIGSPGDFSKCESMADIADTMIAELIEAFRPVDEKDREGLITLLERHACEASEYLAAISARPVTAERVDQLPTNWRDIRPYSAPRRITNGSRR